MPRYLIAAGGLPSIPLTLYARENRPIGFRLIDLFTRLPVDLTGRTLVATVRPSLTGAVFRTVSSGAGIDHLAPTGAFDIRFGELGPGDLVWDLYLDGELVVLPSALRVPLPVRRHPAYAAALAQLALQGFAAGDVVVDAAALAQLSLDFEATGEQVAGGPGPLTHSLRFDGVDDALEIADAGAPNLDIAGPQIAFGLWLYLRAWPGAGQSVQLTTKYGVFGGVANRAWQLRLWNTLGANWITADISEDGNTTDSQRWNAATTGGVSLNNWQYLYVRYDLSLGRASRFSLFAGSDGAGSALTDRGNGIASGTADPAAIRNSANPYNIGASHWDDSPDEWYSFINANLSLVRVWSVVHTLAQEQAVWKTRLTGSEPGLVSDMELTDGAGTAATDNSANGYDMGFKGAPTWDATTKPDLTV